MTEFKPTWLYIKKHNITGLKYFGKTTSKDPHKYKGSGDHWVAHLKKYGDDVSTIWCHLYLEKDELVNEATSFSLSHNIVKSTEWANHQIETGLGIVYQKSKPIYTAARKQQYRERMIGNTLNKGRSQTQEEKDKRANSLKEAYQSGKRVVTDKMREATRKTHSGKTVTDKTRQKQSESAKLDKAWRIGKTNEEIFGAEKAKEIREKKSKLLPPNRKSITINGITYQSIKQAAKALDTTEYKAKKLSDNKKI